MRRPVSRLAVDVYSVHFTDQVHAVNIEIMEREKSAYHHGDLRNALVEAATKLVQEVGADQFSLRDAARTVGVSANATYRHFENKSALLTAVAVAGFIELCARMSQALSARAGKAKSAVDRFKATARAYTGFAFEKPELFRVMFGASGICRLLGNPLAVPGPSIHEIMGEAIEGLVHDGLLPEAQRPGAEVKVWTVVHGFVSLVLEGADGGPPPAQRDAALEDLLEFTVLGLCARPRARTT